MTITGDSGDRQLDSTALPIETARALLRFVEGAPDVCRRHQFFTLLQGQLQPLLPHTVALCGAYDRQRRELVFDVFNTVVLPAPLMLQLRRADSPLLRQLVRKRYTPRALGLQAWGTLTRSLGLLGDLPGDVADVLRKLRQGRIQVAVEIAHLTRAADQIDRAASRLALAVVIAALIIGSSIVMTVGGGPQLLGLPAFGLLGFLGAAGGGLWLLLSIRKARRPHDDG
jgi:hypothetical protein